MKKFSFPLKSVGVLRAHRERIAREALATAVRVRAEAEMRLTEARSRAIELERVRTTGRSGRFRPADDIAFFHAYRRECAMEAEARKQWISATAEVEARRQACVEANREVKAIERLEGDARAAHRAAAFRAEQCEFDEIAGHRAARRQSSR